MRIQGKSDVRPDIGSRGVKLELRRLEGADGGLFADFWCADPAKDKLFGVMVDEVLGRWAAGEGSGPTIAGRVLQTWRALLSSESNNALSLAEQAGLFGELFFLERLCTKNQHALDCWRGPDGHPQDFVTGEWIAEVKSSMNSNSVFIHGPDQLDADPANSLMLTVFYLALGPSGRSLVEQVQRVRDLVGGTECERKLSVARYRDTDIDQYAETRFEVVLSRVYDVKGNFPRITRRGMREQFDDSAIRTLQYELLLSAIAQFKVEATSLKRFPELS